MAQSGALTFARGWPRFFLTSRIAERKVPAIFSELYSSSLSHSSRPFSRHYLSPEFEVCPSTTLVLPS